MLRFPHLEELLAVWYPSPRHKGGIAIKLSGGSSAKVTNCHIEGLDTAFELSSDSSLKVDRTTIRQTRTVVREKNV